MTARTVTATIKDVVGRPDNAEWTFSSVIREGSDGQIITTYPKTVKPVAGLLSVDLDPGVAVVQYGGYSWNILVPDSDANLWDLLSAAIGVPIQTSADLLAAAVETFVENNPGYPYSGLAGKPRLAVEWDSSGDTVYQVGDLVTRHGSLYRCTVADTTGDPEVFEGTRWVRVLAGYTDAQRALWAGVSDEASARLALGLPMLLDVASLPYNVQPGGSNPEVGIQQAIDDAAANGIPEVVISRPGTYTVGLHTIPGQTTYAAALWGRSNVKLTMKPGVIIKLKNSASLPAGATQGQLISMADVGSVKTNWAIEGGLIDGNAANQTTLAISHGIYLERVQSGYVKDVLAKGIYGTASAPPGETFHFEANKCKDVRFVNCEADGSASGNTATGFSSDDSFGVSWISCVSRNMGFGMGFTCWQSAGLRYSGCHAYSNVTAGFNAERSEDIVYAACVAGGQSPFLASGTNPAFPSGQVAVGNGVGFNIHGCTDVAGVGCVSTYNTTGIHIYTNTGISPNLVCTRVMFTGSDFRQNTTNVTIERASDGGSAQDQVEVVLLNCLGGSAAGGAITDAVYNFGNAPIVFYDTNGQSGVRYSVAGQGVYSFRWQAQGATSPPLPGNAALGLTAIGQLHTAGRRLNRRATATDTTIRVVDDVISVTDTTVARTITLPSAATAGAGATYLIKDESGAAATNNITVTRAGSDLIQGQTTRRITTNYGWLRLMSTGSAWIVVDESVNAATGGIFWYHATYASGNYYACNSASSVNTSNTLGNQSLRVSRWVVDAPLPLATLWVEHTGSGEAGSTYRIGIYADDGAGKPGALVLDAGAVATSGAAAVQEVSVSATLQPGVYWVGGVVQGAPTTQPTMRTVNPQDVENAISFGTTLPSAGSTRCSWLMGSVTGALPSTFTPSPSGAAPARIGFKVA